MDRSPSEKGRRQLVKGRWSKMENVRNGGEKDGGELEQNGYHREKARQSRFYTTPPGP